MGERFSWGLRGLRMRKEKRTKVLCAGRRKEASGSLTRSAIVYTDVCFKKVMRILKKKKNGEKPGICCHICDLGERWESAHNT